MLAQPVEPLLEELKVGVCLLRVPKLAEFNALNSKLTTRAFVQQIDEKQQVIDELMAAHQHITARRHADGVIAYFQSLASALEFGAAASESPLNDPSPAAHQWRQLIVGTGFAGLKFSSVHHQFFGFEQDLLMEISSNLLQSARPIRFLTERAQEALAESDKVQFNRRMLSAGGRQINIYCAV